MGQLRAVMFDVGETIVDESVEYGTWADWLGVPRHTFSAVFGAVIARGDDVRTAFEHFRPGFDLDRERARRAADGFPERFTVTDVYADVWPCLAALRAQRLFVGLAGNQSAHGGAMVRSLGLPVIGTSAEWGVTKPDPGFFVTLAATIGFAPAEILYVGDRLDNDMRPAQSVGMPAAALRRGPWGHVLRDPQTLDRCLFRLDSLVDLPGLVAAHNAARGDERCRWTSSNSCTG
ncbi:MAG: HAD family hydrolase [Actinoplanes sp.]